MTKASDFNRMFSFSAMENLNRYAQMMENLNRHAQMMQTIAAPIVSSTINIKAMELAKLHGYNNSAIYSAIPQQIYGSLQLAATINIIYSNTFNALVDKPIFVKNAIWETAVACSAIFVKKSISAEVSFNFEGVNDDDESGADKILSGIKSVFSKLDKGIKDTILNRVQKIFPQLSITYIPTDKLNTFLAVLFFTINQFDSASTEAHLITIEKQNATIIQQNDRASEERNAIYDKLSEQLEVQKELLAATKENNSQKINSDSCKSER